MSSNNQRHLIHAKSEVIITPIVSVNALQLIGTITTQVIYLYLFFGALKQFHFSKQVGTNTIKKIQATQKDKTKATRLGFLSTYHDLEQYKDKPRTD